MDLGTRIVLTLSRDIWDHLDAFDSFILAYIRYCFFSSFLSLFLSLFKYFDISCAVIIHQHLTEHWVS
jgi:hypothetical protein